MSKKNKIGNCVTCNRDMPIEAKGQCKNCSYKYRRKYDSTFYLRKCYAGIKQRCTNPKNHNSKYYYGKEICPLGTFLNRFSNDNVFLEMFKKWQESGFEYRIKPTIDRLDNNKGYTVDNMQILTHIENAKKDCEIPIIGIYRNFFSEWFPSQTYAAKELNLQRSNLWKVINGERKAISGWSFKYES